MLFAVRTLSMLQAHDMQLRMNEAADLIQAMQKKLDVHKGAIKEANKTMAKLRERHNWIVQDEEHLGVEGGAYDFKRVTRRLPCGEYESTFFCR